jgi:acyl dehydratase
MAPVKAGKRIRGRFRLASATERKPGQWRFVHDITVEIEGEPKPALTVEWIGVIFV